MAEEHYDAAMDDLSIPHKRLSIKPVPWHGLVALDLFISSVASGIFVLSAVADLVSAQIYGPIARAGFLIAFVLLIADLISLVGHLGDSARFHHMLRVFKLSSPMSTGVWALSSLAMISFLRASMIFVDAPLIERAAHLLDVIGIPAALYVGAYKGVLLSCTAQIGWKDARWLGAQLSVSCGALGAAALLLVCYVLSDNAAARALHAMLVVSMALELAIALVTRSEMRRGESDEGPPGKALRGRFQLRMIILLTLAMFVRTQPALGLLAIAILINALAFRRELIMIPHEA
jgi:Ni/Fe-hydrogenase subunit HybB-like protein